MIVSQKETIALLFLLVVLPIMNLSASYESKIDNLVNSLSKVKDKTIKKIAVVNFIDTTSKQRYLFSDILEEDLTTKIVNTKEFDVIAKSRIDEVLKELKFGYEGLTDPTKSKQLGKLSQADAILTGTYREKDKDVIITAQLINIETGEAVWAESTSISKDELPAGAMQLPNIYQETQIIPSGEKERASKLKPTGTLSIISVPPEAEIFLDAKRKGLTPAIFQSIIAGERNIMLNKEGYEDYIENVTIKQNETAKMEVIMKRKMGTLKIETKPSGAEIYVHGYKKGISPLSIELIIGTYEVKAKKESYEDYKENITIFYKETTEKTFNLIEEPGSLLIKVEPSPASVYIDGTNKGEANPTLSLEKFPSGQHTVKITKNGYGDYEKTIEIHAHKGETISVILKKEKGKPKYKHQEVSEYKSPSESKKRSSIIDVYLSYKMFTPKNKIFKNMVDNIGGFYFGVDGRNYINVGIDFWSKDDLTVSDITKLEARAWELTLTYPYIINENFLIYAGGGGRFESIDVNPTGEGEYATSDASFGNNMGLFTGGIKLKYFTDEKNSLGIELNYSKSFSAKYTDYNMIRIGVLYGWRDK